MTTTPSTITTITTITNPVLTGMYPDPTWMWDADNNRIAMVNSSFELVPGLPIHVSDDLGRWTHLADAIDEAMARRLLIPFVEDSGGVYAPTLRKVGGKYVIVCTIARIDADAARRGGVSDDELEAAARAEGNFAITAERLEGPWSGPYWIDGAEGIDPDVFEDSDGSVYWTQTRPAVDPQWEGQTEVWTQRIDPETWTLIDDGEAAGCGKTVIWRGYGVEAVWAEGPHLYRIDDYVYLMTAEGGTSFEHSEMVMRVYAPNGLKAAMGEFVRDVQASGTPIPAPRDNERCVLDTHRRLFHANKKNPILTHRQLGLAEQVQCVGHTDLIHHPELGWWIVSLGVRETKGADPGELLSYLGREPFIAPLTWEHNPADWKLDGGGAPSTPQGDPGWPVVAPGLGRLPKCIAIAQDVPAGQFPPADMVLVEDDRAARVAIGASVSEPVSADEARPVMDVDGTAVEIVRAERGVRYARVTSDDCVIPVPAWGTLIVRQNSTHHVTVRVEPMSDADSSRRVTCTIVRAGQTQEHEYGPLQPGMAGVALLLHRNVLTLFTYDGDVREAAAHVAAGEDGCAAGVVLDRYDARFLSTEWAGGFVGCMAGVPVDERER